MKSVDFSLGELVYVKGVPFRVSYINRGKKRISLEAVNMEVSPEPEKEKLVEVVKG